MEAQIVNMGPLIKSGREQRPGSDRLNDSVLSSPECIVAGRNAAEGPDEESPHWDVSEGQPAGPPGETGQGAS